MAACERVVDQVSEQMEREETANHHQHNDPTGLLALRRHAFGHKLPFQPPRFVTSADRDRCAEEERQLVAKEARQARARESRALREASSLAGVAPAAASAAAASSGMGSAATAHRAAAPSNDAGWLRSALEQHFAASDGAAGAGTMYSAVTDCLQTASSEEALQNSLFELLGFERFDLIQEVLQRKGGILQSAAGALAVDGGATGFTPAAPSSQPTRRRPTADEIALASAQLAAVGAPGGIGGGGSRAPAVAGSVTIQTEEEKRLAKHLRKEEKRVWKKANAVLSAAQQAPGEEGLQDLILDRQHALEVQDRAMREMAAQAILDRAQANAGTNTERFPFVFDSLAETKKSAAYVSGSQIMLPSNCERRNEARAEEVTLPPVEHRRALPGERLMPVKALGEIAQLAFRGFDTLNRIQSIVCNAAYRSNENLLVCAPTGAGKTNIAMLAILRAVEQHMEAGVIQRDKFKIIYVAPMKALAAEMTASFGRRLAPLNLAVKELTGDMQLTKAEILKTNMLVTTPEKWDVVTRKSTGDTALAQLVKLLIIDEVHLLHDERGPVIESLVARTLRQVESSQSMIRIVGLSATLPNYVDVARFLRVNPYKGLFYFDGGFRPVPLQQSFIGVKAKNRFLNMTHMDEVCFDKVLENVQRGEQVMVFVHARNATTATAQKLAEIAQSEGLLEAFDCADNPGYGEGVRAMSRSRNKQLKELFGKGFATHHAGMLRSDRSMVEDLFGKKLIKVLCCTATLAWGVNLPAHAVIIKGTQVYDSKQGSFVDLGILDVQQIFGRAGRPQFDTFGEAFLITTHDRLSHYLTRIMTQKAIESNFQARMRDNLNAEIALGTVANVSEAVQWLSYSYLFVRMRRNPHHYGIPLEDLEFDSELHARRREIVIKAARALDDARMIRFQETTELFNPTDLGRTASNFYIRYESIEVYNELFRPNMTEADILAMVAKSQEFEQIKIRDEELEELEMLMEACYLHPVKGGVENTYGKVNILLQAYISQSNVTAFSLVSDMNYVAQNAGRLLRALFEIAIRRNMASMSAKLLKLCKCVDQRIWWGFHTPLRQVSGGLAWRTERMENRGMRGSEAGGM